MSVKIDKKSFNGNLLKNSHKKWLQKIISKYSNLIYLLKKVQYCVEFPLLSSTALILLGKIDFQKIKEFLMMTNTFFILYRKFFIR